MSWLAYRKKRGSLNTGMRVERAAALIVAQQANMHRKQGTPPFSIMDFMSHAEEPAITLESAMESWS